MTQLSDADAYPRLEAFRQLMISEIPHKESARSELEAMGPRDLTSTYLNWRTRLVPMRPRTVTFSKGFWTLAADTYGGFILELVGLIERGEPLIDFQSKRPGKIGYSERSAKVGSAAKGMAWRSDLNIPWDRDSVLNAYGLHHLHVHRGGGNELVYVQFERQLAHFVFFGNHDDFHSEALGEAIAEDNLARGLFLPDIRPPRDGQGFSPPDQKAIEQAGLSSFRVIDGKVVPTAIQSLAGTSVRMENYALRIWREITAYESLMLDKQFIADFFEFFDKEAPVEMDFFWNFNNLDLWLTDRVSSCGRPVLEAPI
jgi:hypothetical protein